MGRNSKSEEARTGVDRWNATEAPKAKKPRKASRKPRLRGDARKYVGTLIAMAVLCVVCIIGFTPLSQRITQGLDIQGGVSVILTASKSDGSTVSSSDMDTAKSIVEKRVNALGSSEATVQLQGSNSILVQIPGATDADATVQTIGQTGHLEFVRLDDIGDAEALAKIAAGTEDVELQDGTYTAFMDGSYIVSSTVESSTTDVGTYAVNVTFNSDGAQIFSDVTSELAPTKGQIAIVLDGVVYSAPSVQAVISDGKVSITGNFTLDKAKELKTVLDSKLTLSKLSVESTGASVANVNMITDGDAQMAILQSDVINYAHEGTNSFDGAPETNALWVAGIYNETVQILAKPGIVQDDSASPGLGRQIAGIASAMRAGEDHRAQAARFRGDCQHPAGS